MIMKRMKQILWVAILSLGLLSTSCQKEGAIGGSGYFFSWAIAGTGENGTEEEEDAPEVLDGFDENGASLAVFTVGLSQKVRFSRGNLQYQGVTDSWRFAGRQYESVGNDNENIDIFDEGWIDLFGWGTSGWESGAECYRPYDTSNYNPDYMPGNEVASNLNGDYAQADWGVTVSVTNGGNKPGMWRTLSRREWQYLMGETYADIRVGKWGLATISKKYHGVIILPDTWETPTGLQFESGSESGWETNTYDYETWDQMESAGAVFLPAAGVRYGLGIGNVGEVGNYWSVSRYNPDRAYNLNFTVYGVDAGNRNYLSSGLSVRLVQPIE